MSAVRPCNQVARLTASNLLHGSNMGKLQEVLKHPDELVPLMQMLVSDYYTKIVPRDPGLGFCYRMLNKVSRRYVSLQPMETIPIFSV